MPREVEAWQCEYCGEYFECEWECEGHEDGCCENPDNKPACYRCERCTKEGYYSPECKKLHKRLPVMECAIYAEARDAGVLYP